MVEADYHLLPAVVGDEGGVAIRGCDGGVYAVGEPVQADPLVALDVGSQPIRLSRAMRVPSAFTEVRGRDFLS